MFLKQMLLSYSSSRTESSEQYLMATVNLLTFAAPATTLYLITIKNEVLTEANKHSIQQYMKPTIPRYLSEYVTSKI